ncbi:MAG TPA: protein translocase subunit SecF [Anaerolineaceae bacterium]|jgi:preprotein translocase subunit SecF|nr:protein translocase subunit SecF [Anaerolineaceae bacterium]
MINLLGKRYYFFLFSLLLIVPGMIVLAIYGLPLAVDFKGGSLLEVVFPSGKLPTTEDVVNIYTAYGFDTVTVQTAMGENNVKDILIIRSPDLTTTINGVESNPDATKNLIVTDLKTLSGDSEVYVNSFQNVGPTIASQVANRAILAIAIAMLAVVVYIAIAFRGVPHAIRYGICAIIAMIHDILIVLSLAAIGGKFFGWQVDSLFLTAMLTVIGFSVQDKIVVFDRIRENNGVLRRLPFEKLVNHSIIQTLQRSINTQLMTVEFMLLALALFGGVTLREFAVILLVGLLSGTYSSIFIAAPFLVVWENKEWKNWFGGHPAEA